MKSKACLTLLLILFQVQILYTCNMHHNNSCEKKYLLTLISIHPLNLVNKYYNHTTCYMGTFTMKSSAWICLLRTINHENMWKYWLVSKQAKHLHVSEYKKLRVCNYKWLRVMSVLFSTEKYTWNVHNSFGDLLYIQCNNMMF